MERGGGTGGAKHTPPPTFVGSGPARECVTGHAQFEARRRTTIRIPVEAAAPVSATARATVGRVTVTATLSKRVVERATVTRELFARQAAIASRRVCVRAGTVQAGHTAALNRSYRAAVTAAHASASKQAAKSLAPDSWLTRDLPRRPPRSGSCRPGPVAPRPPLTRRSPRKRWRRPPPRPLPVTSGCRPGDSVRYPAAPERAASASSTGTLATPTASATGSYVT